MKRFVYILLLFILHACTQELHLDEGQVKNSIVLNINNSTLETKALVPGTPNENKIETLDCFFYTATATENSEAVYYAHFDPDATKQAKVYLYLTEGEFSKIFPNNSTSCKVYVIANLTLPMGEALPEKSTMAQLKRLEIESSEFEYVIADEDTYALNPPQKFIMHGEGSANVSNGSASGDIELIRSASKVTLNLKVPEYIEVDVVGSDGNVYRTERWEPNFEKITDPQNMHVSFHNGVANDYLDSDDDVAEPDYFETFKAKSFTHKETTTDANGLKIHLFSCDAIFYSYSQEWGQGDADAPYFNLVVPWERVKSTVVGGTGDEGTTKAGEITNLKPCYYQVQINPVYRKLESNHWYDLTLNIGVLGSTIEAEPELINDCSYYVIDWSHIDTIHEGDYEEIHLSQWTYLIVNENRMEINNTPTGLLPYEASHSISMKLECPDGYLANIKEYDALEAYNTKAYSAYYVNCGGDSPQAVDLEDEFQDAIKVYTTKTAKYLRFTYPETELQDMKIYSPIYVHLKIWLEIDELDVNIAPSETEKQFLEEITFVYYPPMYIIPDLSAPYSIYVNNVQHADQNTDYKIGNHVLGHVPGVSGSWGTKDSYMYTITVTSFKESNTFKAHDNKNYPYIIGDPRKRESDLELDDNGKNDIATNWVKANAIVTDENGNVVKDGDGNIQYNNRSLQFYYPTANDGAAFQIVSPKFKIVSFHSSGWGFITSKGAAMRCATFQEDGYPAGRWRLPTEAEIMFIIDLQKAKVISDIFYGGSQYYCATEIDDNTRYKISYPANGTPSWTSGTTGSVRCVYDEWFWGADREARINTAWNGKHDSINNDEYFFTWGDKEIIW